MGRFRRKKRRSDSITGTVPADVNTRQCLRQLLIQIENIYRYSLENGLVHVYDR